MVNIDQAAALLREGGLVAFPTETVYGLGADGFSASAVARIFEAKGRPPDNPLILHVLPFMFALPDEAKRVADVFWPGPLTIVIARDPRVPSIVSAGLETMAIRVPAHPIAFELITKVGRPLAAPSANRSGRPSPTTAQHVIDDLGDLIDGVIDGGECAIGLESTVIDCSRGKVSILREGAVTADELAAVLGYAPPAVKGALSSPGTRHAHYRPSCEVILFDEPPVSCEAAIAFRSNPDAKIIFRASSLEDYAHNLYAWFREAEARGVKKLFVERPPDEGIGVAIRNRIEMASKDG